MSEKTVLLLREFKPHQLEEIRRLLPDYRLLSAAEDENVWPDVEAIIGWPDAMKEIYRPERFLRLKWVQATSAGVNYLPLQEFARQGVILTNASGIHSIPIAEHVMGVLLANMRGLYFAAANQQQKIWNDHFEAASLDQKTMLIVGAGHIGRRVAHLAKAFGMKTIGVNRSGREVAEMDATVTQSSILSLLPEADVIVDILPQTEETFHFFDEPLFAAMKKGVQFVNVGRGSTVDSASLLQALEQGIVSFAALDVFEEEPLPADSPLWNHDRIRITPHFSGQVEHFRDELFKIVGENVRRYAAEGRPEVNVVDYNKMY